MENILKLGFLKKTGVVVKRPLVGFGAKDKNSNIVNANCECTWDCNCNCDCSDCFCNECSTNGWDDD